jgi:hypothetical protein
MLFRAIHPFLPNAYFGPMSEKLFADLRACLEKTLKALVKSDRCGILQVYLSLCCSLEKCILNKGDMLLEADNKIDAVYTGLQRLHFGWDGTGHEMITNKDQVKNGCVMFFTKLIQENEPLFSDDCNVMLSLESMKMLCQGLPGHANPYSVAVTLTNLIAALKNAENLVDHTLHGINICTIEKLQESWKSILIQQTSDIYANRDLLSNVSLILNNKFPHSKMLLMDLIKVDDRSVKSDPRWIDILEKNSHLFGSTDDLKSLLQQYVTLDLLDNKIGARIMVLCHQLFCNLSLAKKDIIIHYTLEKKLCINAQIGDFRNAATLVFNKLSSKDVSKSEAAWLVLCNHEHFVKFAVENAVKYSGQGNVIAELLKSLPSVSKHNGLLANEIKTVMQEMLPENEQKNLVQFISQLFATKSNAVLCLKDFVADVILPLVNVEKVKSPSGLPFSSVIEILNFLINVSSKKGFTEFPSGEESAPLLVCLADILDYCSVLWACDRNGAELVVAKDRAMNCLENIVQSRGFILTDTEKKWVKQALSDHCIVVKLLVECYLTKSMDVLVQKELLKDPGNTSEKRLANLQHLFQYFMLLELTEMQQFEHPSNVIVDYSDLILVLSAILPHQLSREWARCTAAVQRLYDDHRFVHPEYQDQHVGSSVMGSQILLDVVQVLASSLQNVTYYTSMMNHVAKCYAVSIKVSLKGPMVTSVVYGLTQNLPINF